MASADYSLRRSVSTGMLNGSLNVGHIRKYPTLVFEASVLICASKFRSKSRTFHHPIPKKNNRILAGERV